MNCKQFQFHLALLVGDDLEPATRQDVLRHLAACPCCREYERQLQAVHQHLNRAAASAETPAPCLWGTLQSRLNAGVRQRAPRVPLSGWMPALATMAACLMVMVISSTTPVFDFDDLFDANPRDLQFPVGTLTPAASQAGFEREMPPAFSQEFLDSGEWNLQTPPGVALPLSPVEWYPLAPENRSF